MVKETSIALLFKALADQTRLRLINLIGDHEICVCFFVEVLNTNQPKISRHLAYLKRALGRDAQSPTEELEGDRYRTAVWLKGKPTLLALELGAR